MIFHPGMLLYTKIHLDLQYGHSHRPVYPEKSGFCLLVEHRYVIHVVVDERVLFVFMGALHPPDGLDHSSLPLDGSGHKETVQWAIVETFRKEIVGGNQDLDASFPEVRNDAVSNLLRNGFLFLPAVRTFTLFSLNVDGTHNVFAAHTLTIQQVS